MPRPGSLRTSVLRALATSSCNACQMSEYSILTHRKNERSSTMSLKGAAEAPLAQRQVRVTPEGRRPAAIAPRLLYVVSEDWYFLSHRLPMARAASNDGFEVHVATQVRDGGAAIKAEGF